MIVQMDVQEGASEVVKHHVLVTVKVHQVIIIKETVMVVGTTAEAVQGIVADLVADHAVEVPIR